MSGPLSRTTAPAVSAAPRALSSFERALSFISLNRRPNSPSCGVRIVAAGGFLFLMAANSACGSSAKLVSASASSTTARSPASAARTSSHIGRPTPPPGPSTTALRRGSRRKSANSSAPSTGRTMTARLAAALTASASRGLAIVTRPAPARRAPRAASRAAPVEASAAGHHDGMPAGIFMALDPRHRKALRPKLRLVGPCPRLDAIEHVRGDADIGDAKGSAMEAPGQQRVADLAAEERDRFSRVDGEAHHRSGGAVDPAREIDRDAPRAMRSWPRSLRARCLRPAGRGRPRTAHR